MKTIAATMTPMSPIMPDAPDNREVAAPRNRVGSSEASIRLNAVLSRLSSLTAQSLVCLYKTVNSSEY